MKNSLLSLVAELSRLLREDSKAKRTEAREKVQVALQKLLNSNGLENLKKAILEQAMSLTQAEGGILLTGVEGSDESLEISAKRGPVQEHFASHIPVSTDSLTAVKAYRQRKAFVVPLFHESQTKKVLLKTDHWQFLAPEPKQFEQVRQWLDELGCELSVPLERAERVIGAVTLHHQSPMHFDYYRTTLLEELLLLAAPALESETQKEDRDLWMAEAIHRLGSRINALSSNLELANLIPNQQSDFLHVAQEQATLLRDLLANIRDQNHRWNLQGRFALEWEKRFSELKDLLRKDYPDCNNRLECSAVIEPTMHLKGDSQAFDFVLGNLICNALQHGEDGSIKLVAENQNNQFWTLRISNLGRIDKTDKEKIFHLDKRGKNARGDGLGMGLAIARRIVRLHGGNLVLKDSGETTKQVIFTLEWPFTE